MLIITFFFVSHRKKLEMSISCFLSIDVLEYAGGFFWLDLTYVYDFRTVRIFFRENPDADIQDVFRLCEMHGIRYGIIREISMMIGM